MTLPITLTVELSLSLSLCSLEHVNILDSLTHPLNKEDSVLVAEAISLVSLC